MREYAAYWGAAPAIRRLRLAAAFVLRHAAPITLAVFAIVGLVVLDDYGVSTDEATQRLIGRASLDYILGDRDALLDDRNRFYGVAFELPLAAVERVFGLDDSRAVYLSRHLLTHLFFLAGGFFAWLLTYRMFGSRALALFAMLLFLLHPRMYAHSFFNTKDIPFLSAFMIALYLIHRAFRRDSAAAFALCGAGVGLLTNIRPLGVLPFAAVLGMMALDLFHAARRADGTARRVLVNGGAFSAAAALTLYATWPLLWNDPPALAEALSTFSRFVHTDAATLFQGVYVQWSAGNIPARYAPVWALITTPPAALALAAVGVGRVAWLGARDGAALRPGVSEARFGALLAACLALPFVAVIVLESNLYNGWRQLYFVWAPACLLAALGLRWTLAAIRPLAARAAIIALVAISGGAVLAQTVALHPHQNDYFNPLVERSERLKTRYQMDYWNTSRREALEWLLAEYPDAPIYLDSVDPNYEIVQNLLILPEADRRRIRVNRNFPDFIIASEGEGAIWTREIYGGVLTAILDRREEARAKKIAAYESARASEPLAESAFDVYLNDSALTYVKEPCEESDTDAPFTLSITPSDPSDLPERARGRGMEHESLNFGFREYGAIFDGKCVILRDLPEYSIAVIETGQYAPGGGRLWTAAARTDPARVDALREALAAARALEPAARSGFDVYLNGKTLTYVKDPCGAEDTRGRFLLSVFPSDADDLPEDAKRAGREHVSLNFDFARYGAVLDGKCVILRPLPEYPISAIETGQWIPGGERLWTARIDAGGAE